MADQDQNQDQQLEGSISQEELDALFDSLNEMKGRSRDAATAGRTVTARTYQIVVKHFSKVVQKATARKEREELAALNKTVNPPKEKA